MERPALQRLLDDVDARRVDCVVVYKVDRLSRSLLDFARLMDRFDQRSASFVSVTQQFNTTTSLGRLTLNILLSFAHYVERVIMQSQRAQVAIWLASQRRATPHYPSPVLDVGAGDRLLFTQQLVCLTVNSAGFWASTFHRKNLRSRPIFDLLVAP